MKLFHNTVSPQLKKALDIIMQAHEFDDFRLVGGTALALQMGHRVSVDIDMFTDVGYGEMDCASIKELLTSKFPYIQGIEALDQRQLGYTLYCGESRENSIKLDIYYNDEFLFPPVIVDGMRMADIRDIAAMKMLAIDGSNRKKDYWDIHELMTKFTLTQMLDFASSRYPYSFDRENAIHKLTKVPTDSIPDVDIIDYRGKFWEFIVEDIQEKVQEENL